jgi:hypothetical protein
MNIPIVNPNANRISVRERKSILISLITSNEGEKSKASVLPNTPVFRMVTIKNIAAPIIKPQKVNFTICRPSFKAKAMVRKTVVSPKGMSAIIWVPWIKSLSGNSAKPKGRSAQDNQPGAVFNNIRCIRCIRG